MQNRDDLTKQIELSSGVHTYCDVGRADRTVLLLHGFAFRQGMYPLMDILNADFRVLVPDLPFSTNLGFSVPHTLDSYVNFLLEFVQALDLKNVSVFGNSVGGTLALLCGIKSPEKFDKLVVRCPLWSSKQLPAYLQNRKLVGLHHFLSGNLPYARFALNLFYRISSRMSPVVGEMHESPISYDDGQVASVVLSRFLGHLVQVEFEDELSLIPNETMILWGGLDTFVKREWGVYLDKILPNSQFVEMSGEYHNIATTNPKTLAEHISTFVAR